MGLGTPSRADFSHQYGPLNSKLLSMGEKSGLVWCGRVATAMSCRGTWSVPIPLVSSALISCVTLSSLLNVLRPQFSSLPWGGEDCATSGVCRKQVE